MSDATKYVNKLKDKHVLIVGGSSGIGFAVAEAAIEHGARVTISSSQQSRVDTAASRLHKSYPSAKDRVSGYAYSMNDKSHLESNIVALLDDCTGSSKTKLDHIIWTAGDALAAMPLAEMTIEKAQQAGMVRFFGPMMLAKHAPKYLNPGPASSIVLTTGLAGHKPIPDWVAISAYCLGLEGLTRALALDLKPLRVNVVCPGAVITELWDGLSAEERQDIFKHSSERALTGQVGRVEDVAECYLYAMKDQNATGEVITTSSGARLR
ncbi:hypothetical protein ANO11243_038420 [Dothideomycetidae sp. 11243]|nr:hypothetical protein ANO11243_038420 [fungal sp. No.11243]